MKYLIKNKTEKTWNDKKYVEATLTEVSADGVTGNDYKVSAWNGEYEGKDEIECELEKNDKGYWKFKKAKLEKPNFIKAKEAQMEKVMERKDQSIGKFQDSKEWSIKVTSSMNKAIDLAIAEYTINKQSLDNLDTCILKWRKWILENWDLDYKDVNAPF